MNQREQLNMIMSKLREYAKDPKGIFTSENIEKAFRNYGIDSNLVGKSLEDETKQKIFLKLDKKENEGKCWIGTGSLNDTWQFFDTNIPRDGSKPNYEWKVYIPINPTYYGALATTIIDFLCDNGIVSHSKIAGEVRSDAMIVNLESEEDVIKLRDYIDTNILKSCLGIHHPFIPDFNGIGVVHTFDKDTSYTERLSIYLAKFLNYCKQQNRLDWISLEGFLVSMQNSLNNNMAQNPDETQQLIENMDIIMNNRDFIGNSLEKNDYHAL